MFIIISRVIYDGGRKYLQYPIGGKPNVENILIFYLSFGGTYNARKPEIEAIGTVLECQDIFYTFPL